ncbi:hypothetical protein GAY31_17460 [Azospirillum brasilense]|nr:hypothetical protein [Azospirillum brasilense]
MRRATKRQPALEAVNVAELAGPPANGNEEVDGIEDDGMSHALPFVQDRDGHLGRDFWCVAGTGNYAVDYKHGEALARRALAYMAQQRLPEILVWIVRAMHEHGHIGGVETGFLRGISDAALRGRAQ